MYQLQVATTVTTFFFPRQRVVEMGLLPSSVKAALKDKLERTGRFCLEVTEALEIVFDYDENRRSASTSRMERDGVVSTEAAPEPETPLVADSPQVGRQAAFTAKSCYALMMNTFLFKW